MSAGQLEANQSRDPLRSTGFYVPGTWLARDDGHRMQGALYVERWQGRSSRRHPIVMLHGGGQSGTCFSVKPDGGDGWAQVFAREGFDVYVVDEPARGRSPYGCDLDGPVKPVFPAETAERLFTATAHHKSWPGAERHSQWPGSGLRGDPIFDRFYASQLPQPVDGAAAERRARIAIAALLREIGPAILLTHSQGGTRGWQVADEVPELVAGILAVEPTGRPFYWPDELASVLRIPPETVCHAFGLTQTPLRYDPPVEDPAALLQWRRPQNRGRWRLASLSATPVILVTAEASYHRNSDVEISEFLTAMGVSNRLLLLEDLGLRGNGHMMMLERNSDEIALALIAALAEWGLDR